MLLEGQLRSECSSLNSVVDGVATENSGHEVRLIWEQCKTRLQSKIPTPFYDRFIRNIRLHDLSPANRTLDTGRKPGLYLAVEDEKHLKHIRANYFALIEKTMRDVNFPGQVSLALFNRDEMVPERCVGVASQGQIAPRTSSASNNIAVGGEFYAHPLNSSDVTRLLAHDFPTTTTVLVGPSGSGKTTLLRCLVNQYHEKSGVLFYTLENFITDFSVACSSKTALAWRKKIREAHLLIIDDFQFIKSSARKTQEEIRYIIDEYQNSGHKLVLCSDTGIRGLPLVDDLMSRLYMSFEVRLHYADKTAREKIINSDLMRLGLDVDPALSSYLSSKITGDVRKIKSAALRLLQLRGQIHSGKFDPDVVDSCLEELYDQSLDIEPDAILKRVALFCGVSVDAIKGPARDKNIVMARHLAIYLCTEMTGMRYEEIARLVCRKKHNSVTHACRKIESKIRDDLFLKNQIEELKAELMKS